MAAESALMHATNLLIDALAALGDKHNAMELATLIVVPIVLSAVLYRIAALRMAKGGPRAALWAAEVPLIFGVYLAITPLRDIRSESYRLYYSVTDRSIGLHYASFYIPLFAALALAGYIAYGYYREKMEQ
ncbi:MAG TPA: hypothetical protein VNI20_11435 [Fimbriimonadaceae bacterium]|nr:hypothetical protein [Fimbriimonadaceae bacterium]